LNGATPQGTETYHVESLKRGIATEHFREVEGLKVSSVGIGTYLGESDDRTDELYRDAVVEAVSLGANVVDTAINYRCQRSERAIGLALRKLGSMGVPRGQILLCTKGGYVPFDGSPPASPADYLRERFFDPGVLRPDDVVRGHSIAPGFLRHQLEASLENLGVDSVDVYYLHNPESQLGAIDRKTFRSRLREAFRCLEALAGEGRLRWYGTATWNGYRVRKDSRDFLSLSDVVGVAREVAGEEHRFRFVQAPYNLAMTEAFTDTNQPIADGELSLCQTAAKLGVCLVASASIAQGQLRSGLPEWLGTLFKGLATDAQRALQFVRSTPGVTAALVGMKSRDHVRENLEIARVPPAPMEDFLKLFEVDSGGERK
jgi:aryl-alcohol dehydrogenase-like predicted oxidoreductase